MIPNLSKKMCAALLIAIMLTTLPARAGWVDDWLTQSTSNPPDYFAGQKRGYYSGGSFSARWPNTATYPLTVEPPRIKSGCGGIDIFLGSFSFLNFEYLVQKLQRILMSGGAVAFDLALKTLCEPCATSIKSFEVIADKLNSLQLDECTAAKDIKAVLQSSDGQGFASMDTIERRLGNAIKENKLSQGLADLYQTITEEDRANKNLAQKPDVLRAVSGCNDEIKEIFLSNMAVAGGSLLENLGVGKLGLSSDYVSLIRGLVGDVRVEGPDNAFKVSFVSPCPQNTPDDVKAFTQGDVTAKDTAGACDRITDANANLVNYVQTRMISVADKMKGKVALNATDTAFIQNSPFSLSLGLKTAVGTEQEAATIATLSDLTAKAYVLQMLVDLYNRATLVMEKASHSLASSENYTNLLSRVKQDSQTSTEAKSFSDQLRNSEQEKWSKSMDNGSAFAMVKDEKVRNMLEANASAGLDFWVVKASGGYRIQGSGEDGEKISTSLSAKEAQGFEENRQRVRAEALTDTLQSSENIAYADNLSKSIGASEAHSYLREAQQINTDTASYNNNQATAFVKGYAAYRYGSDSPENVQKAMTFLNGQAIGSREDQQHLQSLANDFLSGRFDYLETTKTGKTIGNEAQAIHAEQSPLRAQSQSAAGMAFDKTSDIGEQSFPQSNQGGLEKPSRHEVESKFEARQEFFKQERTGQGRIQTNAISRFDSQCKEVNCHRRHLVLIRQPGIMLGRTSKHMSDAAREALDLFAAQFVLSE